MKTKKDNLINEFALNHPFVIILGVIVIFYGGYLFGQWLK